ncbi:MAG: NUDIX domain-containing protein [Erysipelothrix sp.]|nr:NUDIX domain-containing protein [Erysipelothrix sp.]
MTIEQYILKVLSVSKIGLKFSKDDYALENYQELANLSLEMLNKNFTEPINENLFVRNLYPTPNTSVRVIIVNEKNQILFVKEADDKKWTVPGGWADLFISPRENARKEVFEEVGIKVEIERMLAMFMREKYRQPRVAISEYVTYFVAYVKDDIKLDIGFEVLDAGFYDFDNLPELSSKSTKEELTIAYDILINNKAVYVD